MIFIAYLLTALVALKAAAAPIAQCKGPDCAIGSSSKSPACLLGEACKDAQTIPPLDPLTLTVTETSTAFTTLFQGITRLVRVTSSTSTTRTITRVIRSTVLSVTATTRTVSTVFTTRPVTTATRYSFINTTITLFTTVPSAVETTTEISSRTITTATTRRVTNVILSSRNVVITDVDMSEVTFTQITTSTLTTVGTSISTFTLTSFVDTRPVFFFDFTTVYSSTFIQTSTITFSLYTSGTFIYQPLVTSTLSVTDPGGFYIIPVTLGISIGFTSTIPQSALFVTAGTSTVYIT